MLGLYLLAAHMVGDFVLQNRWMAAKKLESAGWRVYHVVIYVLPFVPIAFVYGDFAYGSHGWGHGRSGVVFLVLLFIGHYLTDSVRFKSTLGDWAHWRMLPWSARSVEMIDYADAYGQIFSITAEHEEIESITPLRRYRVKVPLEPNGWPPLQILMDQSLHVAQLALLGGVFLSWQ